MSVLSLLFPSISIRPLLITLLLIVGAAIAGGQTAREDRIRVGDVIEIDQIGSTEFDWRGSVGADGSLIGFDVYGTELNALCRSESELANDIANGFRKILKEPRFAVRIIDRSQRPTVTIDGAVRMPSRFRLMREVRLRELLALAGGLSDSVAGDIIINRQNIHACTKPALDAENSGFEQIRVRLNDLLLGKPEADVEILTGDIVMIEKASVVYIIGGVRNPGTVHIRGEISVSSLIEKAGGFSKDAARTDITIFRRGENGTQTIACGRGVEVCDVENATAKPFDIIEVGAKGSAKRHYAPVLHAESVAVGSNRTLPLRIIE